MGMNILSMRASALCLVVLGMVAAASQNSGDRQVGAGTSVPEMNSSGAGSEGGSKTELVICFRPNRPFFSPKQGGGWTGLEHDILAAFADEQGVALGFHRPSHFAEVFSDLEQGRCDIGAATITKTEERTSRFDFSRSYFPVRIVAVERRGAITTRAEQLRGKKAATIAGSTYLKVIEKIGAVEVVFVANSQEMFDAVAQGRVDFLACDSAIVLAKAEEYPDLQVTAPLSERDELAFALLKGSPWTEPLSGFLTRIQADGGMRRLLLRYFDEEGTDMILSENE